MRIAVQGMGCVSPLGIERRATLPPWTFPRATPELDAVRAGLAPRGLGLLGRGALLALRAANEAVYDAVGDGRLPVTGGLVVGTSSAHHEAIVANLAALRDGGEMRLVLALNGAVGSIAARLAIRFATRAFAYTVASDAAALDAVLEGARMLRAGRAPLVLCGGVEAPVAEARAASDHEPDQIAAAAFFLLAAEGSAGPHTHGYLGAWAASGAPPGGPERRSCAAAVVEEALAGASGALAVVLIASDERDAETVRSVLGSGGAPVLPLWGARPGAGSVAGALALAAALAAGHDGNALILHFSRGRLLAAVVEPPGTKCTAPARGDERWTP